MNNLGPNHSSWNYFNPFSSEFKEAEMVFHDLAWWRQALVVSASLVGGLFIIVGAFPLFCWTVKALDPLENEQAGRVGGVFRRHVDEGVERGNRANAQEALDREALEAFRADPIVQRNIEQKDSLRIQFIGIPNEEDQRVLFFVEEYLEWIHDLRVEIAADPLPVVMQDSRRRDGHLQLEATEQWQALENANHPHENSFLLGCTNEDLYPKDKGWNFTLGGSGKENASGVFSLNLLYDRDGAEGFNKTIMRAMKLAAGQVGLMRGIEYCQGRENCCGKWVGSIAALDRVPLYFCLQDMAKISHVAGENLRDLCRRHLNFFLRFNERYADRGVQIDFGREIAVLTEKLRQLDAP